SWERVFWDALSRGARGGVRVDVGVRGICARRPGVPGLSDMIRVRIVLVRFLEHSRVFAFENGGEPEVWLGSSDLMHRNLDRRVEARVTVTDLAQRDDLLALLDRAMDPGTHAPALAGDGTWTRARPRPGETLVAPPQHLYQRRIPIRP
ncbi:RNA degradosome polyphosphate kinase, partial [Actinomadura sp. BRA 177]|nr:RNA degradosome polyphosphate kinase [Actinomadura sp. BRA 177]